MVFKPWEEEFDSNFLLRAEHSSLLSFVHWAVVGLCINYHIVQKKRLLWLWLRNAIIYEYEHMNLRNSLLLCPFSKIVVFSFPWSLWPSQPKVFVPVESCHEFFKSNQKVVGYTYDIYVTILQVGIFYQPSCYCIWMMFETFLQFQSSQMSKTIDFFSLSIACTEPSSIMKARDKMTMLIQYCILHVLWLKYAISSAVGC